MRLVAVMEDPGGGEGSKHGASSFPFFNDEAAKFKYDELFASDALLLGRVTYEGFAKAWLTMTGTGDFGERMNSMPKYVGSTTRNDVAWTNSRLIKGNVTEEISSLKQPGQDLLLSGSAQLFQSLMQDDLIDEYRLMVHPVVLGGGERLFGDENNKSTLKLKETKSFASGIVILSYEPSQTQ